jgi:hypothetical protein
VDFSALGVEVHYSVDFSAVWEMEHTQLTASMNPKSAQDAAAYGILLAEQLTAADIPVEYSELQTSSWVKWVPPEFDDGSKRNSRRNRLPEEETFDDGKPSSSKLALSIVLAVLLLRVTYDKVSACAGYRLSRVPSNYWSRVV